MDKSFKDWTAQELFFHFGLDTPLQPLSSLNEWLEAKPILAAWQVQSLERLLAKANQFITSWNEQELQTKFIAPIIELVNFDEYRSFIASFLERKISVIVNKIKLSGKVDWMVAVGRDTPTIPFFFIHEYKKEKGSDNDPRGQLLVTMLAAQMLNKKPSQQLNLLINHQSDAPIYGCYIIGRFWYFVVLDGKTYSISQAYNATKIEDLHQIVACLQLQKKMIFSRLKR